MGNSRLDTSDAAVPIFCQPRRHGSVSLHMEAEKLVAELGYARAVKYAETLMQAVQSIKVGE